MSFAFDLGSNEDVRANADRDLRAARGWKHALRCPLAGRGGRAIPRLDPIRIASLRTTMGAEVSEQPIFKRILCGVDGTNSLEEDEHSRSRSVMSEIPPEQCASSSQEQQGSWAV